MKGGKLLPKKVKKDKVIEKAKKQLGEEIARCRGETRSQRNLASAVGLSPSNMKYIEDGVNAPSAECYINLIDDLKPPPKQQKKMDALYTTIRKTPPPDVCGTINNNQDLFDVFRLISDQILSKEQITQAKALFKSFADEHKGGNGNGK